VSPWLLRPFETDRQTVRQTEGEEAGEGEGEGEGTGTGRGRGRGRERAVSARLLRSCRDSRLCLLLELPLVIAVINSASSSSWQSLGRKQDPRLERAIKERIP
jgi:hypothetical protein